MGIVVSEYGGGNASGAIGPGFLEPKIHATPEAAARDIIERRARNASIVESNQNRIGQKIEPTTIAIHETHLRPGDKISMMDIQRPDPLILHQTKKSVDQALKGSSGVMKAVVGAAGVMLAGVAAAAEPGATPASVGNAMAESGIPGWTAARQGQACKAFGAATGFVAEGLTITAGTVVTVPTAVTLGTLSGPLAPVTGALVAAGGAVMTKQAADGASALGTYVGEAGCNAVSSGVSKIMSSLGMKS